MIFSRLKLRQKLLILLFALARRIINIRPGEIWIEPNANVSSACFVFELPAATTASQPLN